MANLYLDLPVPAGDGVGAAVDTSAMGGKKTLTVRGVFSGVLGIEISNEGAAGPWVELTTFNGDGRVSKKTLRVAARFMRVSRRSTNPIIGGVPNVDVAANDNGGLFFDLPSGNPGASIDVSAAGGFKTAIVSGLTTGGVAYVEISEDGVDWVQCFTFAQNGLQSKFVSARFMRAVVIGGANIDVGAINDPVTEVSEIDGASQCLVFRPGSGFTGPTIFEDWDALNVRLAALRAQNNGGGCYQIAFDDSIMGITVPAGAGNPYSMDGVEWIPGRPRQVIVRLTEGLVLQNLRKISGPLFIDNDAATTSPIADFASGERMELSGCQVANGGMPPVFDLTPMGPGAVTFVFLEGAELFAPDPVIQMAAGQTVNAFCRELSGLNSGTVGGPIGATLNISGAANRVVGELTANFLGTISDSTNAEGPERDVIPVPPAAAAVAPFGARFFHQVQRFDVSGGGFTQTLPSLPVDALQVKGTGRRITIKEESGSVGLLVAPAGGNTIEGAAASVAVPAGGSITFIADGVSNWIIESISDPAISPGQAKWNVTGPFTAAAPPVGVALGDHVRCDPTAAGFAVPLPAVSPANIGCEISIKNISISINALLVTPAGADTIDGAAGALVLAVAFSGLTLVSDGVSNWDIR